MLTLPLTILMLVQHWLFDWAFQTDKQAKGKSKDNFVLLEHVLIVFIGLALFVGIWIAATPGLTTAKYLGSGWLFVITNTVAHFIIDYFTSRATSQAYAEGKTHTFFTTIGFDQLLHYVVMFTTAYYWL